MGVFPQADVYLSSAFMLRYHLLILQLQIFFIDMSGYLVFFFYDYDVNEYSNMSIF